MPNTPEGQKGMEDLTREDRKVAADLLQAEQGIEHPELKEREAKDE